VKSQTSVHLGNTGFDIGICRYAVSSVDPMSSGDDDRFRHPCRSGSVGKLSLSLWLEFQTSAKQAKV
jgi:hypothetical protein